MVSAVQDRVPLLGGTYQSASLLASAQVCRNLYPEATPPSEGEEVSVAHRLRPGLGLLAQCSTVAEVRCLYESTLTRDLFAVVGSQVFWVPMQGGVLVPQVIGNIQTGSGIVSMIDNGVQILIADGTVEGYLVTQASGPSNLPVFSTVSMDNNAGTEGYGWQGATSLDVIDGFTVGVVPNGSVWFSSYDNEMVFDSTYVSAANGYPDQLQALAVIDRYVWLFGDKTTELWFDAGGATFPFAIVAGPFIQYGVEAPRSVAKQAEGVCWLAKDRYGVGLALKGQNYKAVKISNYALEAEWKTYSHRADAIGASLQIDGHRFWVLTFPSADKTWMLDLDTGQWSLVTSGDSDGQQHRWRVQCAIQCYGMVIAGDFENGMLYEIGSQYLTDNGTPILRERNFPHQVGTNTRKVFHSFIADMEVGNPGGDLGFSEPQFDLTLDPAYFLDPNGVPRTNPLGAFTAQPPVVCLAWSDDRGKNFGNPVQQTMGATGQTGVSVLWDRLGMTRDRVYKLFWDAPVQTTLVGAFAMETKGRS